MIISIKLPPKFLLTPLFSLHSYNGSAQVSNLKLEQINFKQTAMSVINSLSRLNSPIAYWLVDTSSTHDPKCQTANNQLNWHYYKEKTTCKVPPFSSSHDLIAYNKFPQSPPHSTFVIKFVPNLMTK